MSLSHTKRPLRLKPSQFQKVLTNTHKRVNEHTKSVNEHTGWLFSLYVTRQPPKGSVIFIPDPLTHVHAPHIDDVMYEHEHVK